MKLGYACINTELNRSFKDCRLKTIEKEGLKKVKQIALNNLETTRQILLWNYSRDILFYRMTSNMIPFASHDIMTWRWWEDEHIIELTEQIKEIKNNLNMRVSMHPPQFTVLSTPRKQVLDNSIKDLTWHAKLMDMIDGDDLIVHGGGAYGNIKEASIRFALQYMCLPNNIKSRLRLENDDKTYSLKDVMYINDLCGIPICLDIHHHNCHNNNDDINYHYIYKTWEKFGTPKVHISTGKTHFSDLRHHDYVSKKDFDDLMEVIQGFDVDIMFESKMKEQSVLPYIE